MSSPSGRAIPRSRNRSRHRKGSRSRSRYPSTNNRNTTPPSADLYSRIHLNPTGHDSFRRNDTPRSKDSTQETIRKLLPEYEDALYSLLRKGYTFGDLVELFNLDKYILRDAFEKRELNIIVQRSNRTLQKSDPQLVIRNLRNSGALGGLPSFGETEPYDADLKSASTEPDHTPGENHTVYQNPEVNSHPLNISDASLKDTNNDYKKTPIRFSSKAAGMQHIGSTTPATILANSIVVKEKDILTNDTMRNLAMETSIEDSNGGTNVARKESVSDDTDSYPAQEDTVQENDPPIIATDNKVTRDNETFQSNTVTAEPVKQDMMNTTENVNPATTEPEPAEAENNVVDALSTALKVDTSKVSRKVNETPSTAVSESIENFNEDRMATAEREIDKDFPLYDTVNTTSRLMADVPENSIEPTPAVINNESTDIEYSVSVSHTTNEEQQIQTDDSAPKNSIVKIISEKVKPLHTLVNNKIKNERTTASESEDFKGPSSTKRTENEYNGLDDTYDDIPLQENKPMDQDKFYDSDTPLSRLQVYKEDEYTDDRYMEVSDLRKTTEHNDFDKNAITEEISNDKNWKQSNERPSDIDIEVENDNRDKNIAVNSHIKQYPKNNVSKEIEELLQRNYPFNLSTIDLKNEGEITVANNQSGENNNVEELVQDNSVPETETDTLDNEKETTIERSKFLTQLSDFEQSHRSGLQLLKKAWEGQSNPSIIFDSSDHFKKIIGTLRGLAKDIQQFGDSMEFDYSHPIKDTKTTMKSRSEAVIKQEGQIDSVFKLTRKQRAGLTKSNFKVNPNSLLVVPPSELDGQNRIRQPVRRSHTRKPHNGNLNSKQTENIPIQNTSAASVFEINPLYSTQQTQPIPKTTAIHTNNHPIHDNMVRLPERVPDQQLQTHTKNPFYDTTQQIGMPNSQIGDNHINTNNINIGIKKMTKYGSSNSQTITKRYDHTEAHVPNHAAREPPRENKNVLSEKGENTQNTSAITSFSSHANNSLLPHQQNATPSGNNEKDETEIFTKKLNKFRGETQRGIDQISKNDNAPIVPAHNSFPQKPDNSPVIIPKQRQDLHYLDAQNASSNIRGVPAKMMSRRSLKQQRAARKNNAQFLGDRKDAVHGMSEKSSYTIAGQPPPRLHEMANKRQGLQPDKIPNQPNQRERRRYLQASNVVISQLQHQQHVTGVATPNEPPELRSVKPGQSLQQSTDQEIVRLNYDPNRNLSQQPAQQIGRANPRPIRLSDSSTGPSQTSDDYRNVNNTPGQSIGLLGVRGINHNVIPSPQSTQTNIEPGLHPAHRDIITNTLPLPRKRGRYGQVPPRPSSRYSNSYINRQSMGFTERHSQMGYPSQVSLGSLQPKRNYNNISNPSMDEPLSSAPKRRNSPQDNQTAANWDNKDESQIVDNSFIQLSKVCIIDSTHI